MGARRRFRSDLFEIEPGEGGRTDPGVYGKALARGSAEVEAELAALLAAEPRIRLEPVG